MKHYEETKPINNRYRSWRRKNPRSKDTEEISNKVIEKSFPQLKKRHLSRCKLHADHKIDRVKKEFPHDTHNQTSNEQKKKGY